MSTSTKSKVRQTWEDRIASGTFTKSECNQWAKAVLPISGGERAGGFKTNLTETDAGILRAALMSAGGVRLHADHTAQGLAWIKKNEKLFPAGTLENFSHFTYHGSGRNIGSDNWPHYVPVWRTHLKDGSFFDYAVVPWQNGGSVKMRIEMWEAGF